MSNPVYNRYPTLNVNSKNNKIIYSNYTSYSDQNKYTVYAYTGPIVGIYQFLNLKKIFFHLLTGLPNSTCKPLNGTSMNLGFTSLTVQKSMMGQTTQEFRFHKAPPLKNATTTFKWWVTQRSFRMTFWILSLWKGSKISQRGQTKSVNGPWMHLNSSSAVHDVFLMGDDSISERLAT